MYLGIDKLARPVNLPTTDLLTHGVILGRTGSGKTGLTIAAIEEAARAGASVLVLDPKGDLTNLALALTTPQQFQEWVEPHVNPGQAFQELLGGLAQFGLGLNHAVAYKSAVDTVVYAPGKTFGGGRSINVFPAFTPPKGSGMPAKERASRDVSTVLRAVADNDDPYDPALVFLTAAVGLAWQSGRPLPVEQWPGVLTAPPAQLASFGGMALEDFFPKRSRTNLARKLIGFRQQADRWLQGEKLDFHKLTSGKPTISVMTLRHLSEEDRLFVTSIIMNRLVDFMFETAASQKLKLLVVLDEARGYLPPYPYNPPTKAPICTLLAQGRAQGIGMLIGTQNPMDLDYKALSNVGTWFVGRLRERDCARDLLGELKQRGVAIDEIEKMPGRTFLLLDKQGTHHRLTVRQPFSYLRGPLGPQELLRLEPIVVRVAQGYKSPLSEIAARIGVQPGRGLLDRLLGRN